MEDQSATAWKDTVRKKSKVFYYKIYSLEKSSCIAKINVNIPGTYYYFIFHHCKKKYFALVHTYAYCITGEVVTKCTLRVAVKFTKSLQKARHIFRT
jgi:hypothetical protein